MTNTLLNKKTQTHQKQGSSFPGWGVENNWKRYWYSSTRTRSSRTRTLNPWSHPTSGTQKNQKRYDSLEKGTDEIPDMIPWTGTQAQLMKLFYLLANDAECRLLEWDEIRHSIIATHFKFMKTGKPYSPVVMKRLDLANYSKKKLITMCVRLGLPKSGTKKQLMERKTI